MSLSSIPRIFGVALLSASLTACAHSRFELSAAEPSASNDGSKSDGSKSDGSKSDNSQSDGSKSDNSSDGSSDSKSETSGTVTTGDKNAESSSNVGLYILTGALLLGATTIVGLVLINQAEPVAYMTRHERGIRLALTRGEGPFILDVADNLRLPRELLPTLGMTLRNARASLEPHLVADDPEIGLTREDGRRFAESLARALHAEPALTPYVSRLMDEAAVVMGASER